MSINNNLPTYQTLFGQLDFKKGADARSVYSPAAYLADLLQLMDDHFEDADFKKRRPDIASRLTLNEESTFTLQPYLSIVNEVLETIIAQKSNGREQVYELLKKVTYPCLSFHLDNEKVKKYSHFLGVKQQELYQLFATSIQDQTTAQSYLGLSDEDYAFIAQKKDATDEEALKAAYKSIIKKGKVSVADFMKVTGFSASTVRTLLFGNLSATAKNSAHKTEREGKASSLFINAKWDGFMALDEAEEHLIWVGETSKLNWMEWFKRVYQLYFAAKKIGISITDLDTILRICCAHQLDHHALQKMAIIKQFHDKYECPIDKVCGLLLDMDGLGIGDDKAPKDILNRIFNGKWAAIDQKYIPTTAYVPKAYEAYEKLVCKGDFLLEENRTFRNRIQKALHLSSKDLQLIVERFREYTPNSVLQKELSLEGMVLLYRIAELTNMLDISCEELLNLFDILMDDPAIRQFNNFEMLIGVAPEKWNTYAIFESKDFDANAWLVQLLFSVTTWAQEHDLNFVELKQIVSGQLKDQEAEEKFIDAQIAMFNSIYQQFKTIFPRSDMFASARFDQRTARLLYDSLLENKQLVSPLDSRVLTYHEEAAHQLGMDVIGQLAMLRKEDFLNIGIAEKMLDRLYNNLILKGYLNLEGSLIEENFPKTAEEFTVASDFSDLKDAVCDILYKLYQKNANYSDEVELTLFPSDFRALELTEIEKEELYANLIFNNYIDEKGNVLEAELFRYTGYSEKAENAKKLALNSNLLSLSPIIYDKISQQIQAFEEENLILKANIFEDLPLKEKELEDLMENLQFNAYLNEDHHLQNKAELLHLPIQDFDIALVFYPYRRKILAAIQQFIRQRKTQLLTLQKEDLADFAEELVGDLLVQDLKANYYPNEEELCNKKIKFFSDPNNFSQFSLPPYFTENYKQIVFNQLAKIAKMIHQYQFTPSQVSELDFSDSEYQELVEMLEEQGFLAQKRIPKDQLSYFLNINHALDFKIDKFEDFSKDIFFLLRNIAQDIEASIADIQATIKTWADAQNRVLFRALQDALGMNTEVLKVICAEVFTAENKVEAIIVPLLTAEKTNDQITTIPNSRKFNIAYRRVQQFALLNAKLNLSKAEMEVVFREQGLVGKFPENITLPKGLDSFDALLEDTDGFIYLFKGNEYWTWAAESYNPVGEKLPLHNLSERFEALTAIDAAFIDDQENTWLLSGTEYFCKKKGTENWIPQEKTWGKIDNDFTDPEQIKAAFQDHEGRTFLFAGDQYIRYSGDLTHVDEGYPKNIKGNWKNEFEYAHVPPAYNHQLTAAFQGIEDKTYFFTDQQFICSDDFSVEKEIPSFWGKLQTEFDGTETIDACYTHDDKVYLFVGEQVFAYSNSIENKNVYVDEGFPKNISNFIPNLPEEFAHGIDAIFKGTDGNVHLYKEEYYLQLSSDFKTILAEKLIVKQWGKIRNVIANKGTIDAAFTGLDGRTYLFSGSQYYRYSKKDYSKVDEGYPRTIANDWGGLEKVDAAFILEGKTYLFGEYTPEKETTETASGAKVKKGYVCYSSNDYSVLEEDYPKTPNDNWWNLPFELVNKTDEAGNSFATPDAIFIGKNGNTYLFSGNQYIYFEKNKRWWSTPKSLAEYWDSIPFQKVDAAFTGKDGRTYLFSGNQFIRYSDWNYNKIDDRFPKKIKSYWGKVSNTIERRMAVDSAVVVESRVTTEEQGVKTETKTQHTYLFSGNQFFRYKNKNYRNVEEGYPKNLKYLKDEPRFRNFDIKLDHGIDAVFADKRNVYLFKDDNIYVSSDQSNQTYENVFTASPRCAFIDKGKLHVLIQKEWKQFSNLEGNTPTAQVVLPPILRTAPPDFREELDAVLKGTDGNTYLFKGADCYNVSLEKSYPLKEEWGRANITVQVNNSINAIFEGQDNKIYLFSGDQYLTYSLPETTDATDSTSPVIPAFVDAYPKKISEDFGGLNNVALAFVRDGKTYLFEKADEDGNQRYVCYPTKDYQKLDPAYPKTTDIHWWKLPASYIEEGFDRVDAVLFEGDNMFLIKENEFVQYDTQQKNWTYPKPLDRIWRGIPLNTTNFETVKTAFTASNGTTYFFSEEAFVGYQEESQASKFSEIKEIKQRWGKMDNNIVEQQKIDAAVVFGEITYLFSGDQYVRYSTNDYEFIDEAYPKHTLEYLRQEEAFPLPDHFELVLENLFKAGKTIHGIVANERTLFFFEQKNLHLVSSQLTQTYDLNRIGKIRNNIQRTGTIDAAFVNKKGHSILFSGDQFYRYSGKDYTHVDEGYPKSIGEYLAKEEGMKTLPEAFHYDLDAAVLGHDGVIYLFKDEQYYASNKAKFAQAISQKWGKIDNVFEATDDAPNIALDAVLLSPNGRTYAFKGGQYIRYEQFSNDYIDADYPKAIKDDWGNMPLDFEEGIDGAFVFEGKTYLTKGDQYIRYTKSDYTRVDPIFPQAFKQRWGNWADFLLTDLHAIFRYKDFVDKHSDGDHSLTDVLNDQAGDKADPYLLLSTIFDWDLEEVKWLKRHNAFLPHLGELETRFDLEIITQLYAIFQLADKMGAYPSELYQEVWANLFKHNNTAAAATALLKYLALTNSEKDWMVVSKQIIDELNLLKRDALVPYVIMLDKQVDNSRDLYGKLLIDVDMGSEANTSKVKEALAALQLYFHRYFVDLESLDIKGTIDEARHQQLKQQWYWMKNYRVWEANRKVFLYPENYIRPELRDTKTPAFKALEENLMQGEMNDVFVQQAYNKYLDEYTEVSRLTIAGGYVYKEPKNPTDLNLVLFGKTKTDPTQYYYRLATFLNGATNTARWYPWIPVGITIDAKRVYPIYAFGRMFVFWGTVEQSVEASNETTMTITANGDQQTVKNDSKTTYTLKVYYSFYDLNKNWKAPQLLDTEITSTNPINDFELYVEEAKELEKAKHENIIIKCRYQRHNIKAYYLTPELYTVEVKNPKSFDNSGMAVFKSIFSDKEEMSEKRLVSLNTFKNSTDGPWFSFDHKGGSFLVKPATVNLDINHLPVPLKDNNDDLPHWNKVDAAVRAGNTNYFFNNSKGVFVSSEDLSNEIPIKSRWGNVKTNIAETGIIDAAFFDGEQAYIFSGDEYLVFSKNSDLTNSGRPLKIKDSHFLPKTPITASFTKNNISYFFDGNNFIRSTNLTDVFSVQNRWSTHDNPFIIAAFVHKTHAYLFDKSQYIRYVGSDYSVMEEGYPKTNSLFNLLEDLGCTNNSVAFKTMPIDAAINTGSELILSTTNSDSATYKYIGTQIEKVQNTEKISASLTINNTTYRFKLTKMEVIVNGKITNRVEFIRLIRGAFLGADQQIYIFNGMGFLSFPNVDMTPELFIDHIKAWKNGKSNWTKWRKSSIDLNWDRQEVTAAHYDDKKNKIYIFKGADYSVFTGDARVADKGYPKHIKTLLGEQSEWDSIDATVKGKDGQVYYFNNSKKESTSSADTTVIRPTADWGKIENNILKHGINAAYVDDNKLYLISDQEIFRYSITNNKIADYVDSGYPKTYITDQKVIIYDGKNFTGKKQTLTSGEYNIDTLQAGIGNDKLSSIKIPNRLKVTLYKHANFNQRVLELTENARALPEGIDNQTSSIVISKHRITAPIRAAYSLKGKTHVFFKDQYLTVKSKTDLSRKLAVTNKTINGSWGNLRQELLKGFDASINTGDTLIFFTGNQYIKYELPKDGKETAVPYEADQVKYDIIRLTSGTGHKLNQRLLLGGIDLLLNLQTQEIDEVPNFSATQGEVSNFRATNSNPGTIRYKKVKVRHVPASTHLDFNSANGIYYWEIFFHTPYLIAQSLYTAQRFEEAKRWFEFIYDPTDKSNYWKFLPFLSTDVQAIIDAGKNHLSALQAFISNANLIKKINQLFDKLLPFVPIFQGNSLPSTQQLETLKQLEDQEPDSDLNQLIGALANLNITDEKVAVRKQALIELLGIIAMLSKKWGSMQNNEVQIQTYLDDPFDPHAIAGLRPIAYQKAIVMAYVDNLLNWGDLLFRQYTIESINEARMLYILAYDLLGRKPESLGTKILSEDQTYQELINADADYDFLLYLKNASTAPKNASHAIQLVAETNRAISNSSSAKLDGNHFTGTVHDSIEKSSYFFIPENDLFLDYWDKVEDRLYKIRQSQNILGIKQPLPLFQPPIDPAALVRAASAGGGISAAVANVSIAVPHYRFSFMLNHVKGLIAQLNHFGDALLTALEKQDGEALTILQNKQEALILATREKIKTAQLGEAQANIRYLIESHDHANHRVTHFTKLLEADMNSHELAQLALTGTGAALMEGSAIIKLAAGVSKGVPQFHIGPWCFGTEVGGKQKGDFVQSLAESMETGGDGISMMGDAVGQVAQFERTKEDWQLQQQTAESEVIQIQAQLEGAKLQEVVAQYEINLLEKEREHNETVATFFQDKFTNQQLYQWMANRLSSLYFQTYKIAFDAAKQAEKAFQFERGLTASEVSYISQPYWDSQRKGLLAGQSLSVDLTRMEQAFIQTDQRRFEITKPISLLELNPLAFLELKTKGVCEFSFDEALFDYDFQGHYCRQIKSIAITFDIELGYSKTVFATLTQLHHKTIIAPDAKAVKFLLNPKDDAPLSIRSDWRGQQQITISRPDGDDGMFNAFYNDERYLHFEGTGAVSTWRLELHGKKGDYDINGLNDVSLSLDYTALQGGENFATAVKGLLKPYPTAVLFDVAAQFPDAWEAFQTTDSKELQLPLFRDYFPNMSSSKITGLYTQFVQQGDGKVRFLLNNDDKFIVEQNKYLPTAGLSINKRGTDLVFKLDKGDKEVLDNITLVLAYTAAVK